MIGGRYVSRFSNAVTDRRQSLLRLDSRGASDDEAVARLRRGSEPGGMARTRWEEAGRYQGARVAAESNEP